MSRAIDSMRSRSRAGCEPVSQAVAAMNPAINTAHSVAGHPPGLKTGSGLIPTCLDAKYPTPGHKSN